jgi:hypothetical protein
MMARRPAVTWGGLSGIRHGISACSPVPHIKPFSQPTLDRRQCGRCKSAYNVLQNSPCLPCLRECQSPSFTASGSAGSVCRRAAMQVVKKSWFWVLLALAVGLLTLHTTSPVSRYNGGLPETRTQKQQLVSPDTSHEHTANAAGER